MARLALGTLLVCSACSGPAQPTAAVTPSAWPTSAASPAYFATPASYVPWRDLPATNRTPEFPLSTTPPFPIPEGTPACRSGQLAASAQASVYSAKAQETPVNFRNTGSTACFLQGFPNLTIYDAQGNAVAHASGPDTSNEFHYFPVVPILLSAARSTADQAVLDTVWSDCTHRSTRLDIDLPDGGGTVTIAYVVDPYNSSCQIPGSLPGGLARGPFAPRGVAWPPQPERITDAITLQAPDKAQVGSSVVYFVTIHNTSTVDYGLQPCPDYYESILGSSHSHQLNCAPAGRIGPGESLTFEMRGKIPSTAQPGPADLTWYLSDARLAQLRATARLELTT